MVDKCATIAARAGLAVHFLHVSPGKAPVAKHVATGKFTRQVDYHKIIISNILQKAILRMRNSGIVAKFQVVSGPVARKIAEVARDIKADMLIMGCQTHNALHHLVHGSVPAEVMKQLDLPVMLLPVS